MRRQLGVNLLNFKYSKKRRLPNKLPSYGAFSHSLPAQARSFLFVKNSGCYVYVVECSHGTCTESLRGRFVPDNRIQVERSPIINCCQA